MPCEFNIYRVQENCQFDVPEDSLIEYAGHKRCMFHAEQHWNLPSGNRKDNLSSEEIDHFSGYIRNLINESRESETELNLRGVIFPSGIKFEDSIFHRVIFDGAEFLGKVSFNQSTFNHDASFQKIVFHKGCSFQKVSFNKEALFTGAVIRARADFRKAVFKGNAIFDNTEIYEALYTSAHFHEFGVFHGAKIRRAIYRRIRADGDMIFTNAQFKNRVFFNGAVFNGDAGFSLKENISNDEYFMPAAIFVNATFNGNVTFNNRKFMDTTSFLDASFLKAPSFHNCDLHQDTIFERTKFNDVSAMSASAYRTLKHQMEKVRDRRQEGIFYALEQRCSRKNKNIPWSVRALSWLYDSVSVYGQSVWRPFALLVASLALFSLIYAVVGRVCCDFSSSFDSSVAGNIFRLSIKQVVNPFRIWRIDELPAWLDGNLLVIQSIATLQSLLSLAFLALFFLALRWRFKRG